MLEIVQTGQAGKTGLLFDMHRLRKRVFKDRLGWDVRVTSGGLEVDDFDLPDAVYLLALNSAKRVIGTWRLLPTSGPTMIRDLWPQFLENFSMPSDPHVWEASRFAVDCPTEGAEDYEFTRGEALLAKQELFCGLTELCLLCGIREVVTLYDMRLASLLQRLDCRPRLVTPRQRVGDVLCEVGAFATDEAMLARLRAATGLHHPMVTPAMIPPVLQSLVLSNPQPERS